MSELATIGAGFPSPALDSQRVFRGALDAMAHPGRIVRADSGAALPARLDSAAAAIALTLLDQDTRLWLSSSLPTAIGTYLRFHTGCAIVAECRHADFALVDAKGMPLLKAFSPGSQEYPDRSATVIVHVESLAADGGWHLSGPGIEHSARLAVRGLGPDFIAEWQEQRRRFPRGVDLFLSCGALLCGLPRSVEIEA